MRDLPRPSNPIRDAERSRQAILSAATELFAEQGFAATTMQQVGERAGVSRGLPGYLFGSKDALYRAVLDQAFAEARQTLLAGAADPVLEDATDEERFSHGIEVYIDFLASHPAFVRLVEWEALRHGANLRETAPYRDMVMSSLEAIGNELAGHLPPGFDTTQLLLSVAGLCWFPMAHGETMAQALGIDTTDRRFLEARKRHVVDLVLRGVSGLSGPA